MSPILLLPRAELPLSYLEPTASNSPFFSAHLFFASIPALDTLGVAKQGAIVLIAKLETERSLYAVERVGLRTYAICKLGIWVNIEDLRAAALVTRNDSRLAGQDHGFPERGTGWWKPATLEEDRAETQRAKRSRLVKSDEVLLLMKQSQCKGPKNLPIAPSPVLSPSQVVPNLELARAADVPSHPPLVGPTAQETLEIIRTQYLEALHLSKVNNTFQLITWVLSYITDFSCLLCQRPFVTRSRSVQSRKWHNHASSRPNQFLTDFNIDSTHYG